MDLPLPPTLLARASTDDPLNVNTLLVLASAAVVAAPAVLAAVPVLLAYRRRRRNREAVVGFVVVWALAASGVSIVAINRSWSASAERQRQILSGDYDPHDLPPEPATPWPLWGGLAAAYVGLVAWATAGPARPSAPSTANTSGGTWGGPGPSR